MVGMLRFPLTQHNPRSPPHIRQKLFTKLGNKEEFHVLEEGSASSLDVLSSGECPDGLDGLVFPKL